MNKGFQVCPSCRGSGDSTLEDELSCGRCFGSGEIEVFRPNRYVRKPVAEGVEQLGLL